MDKEKNIFKRLFRSYEAMEKADYAAETGDAETEFDSERLWMEFRNIFVFCTAVLFLLSLVLHAHMLRGIAYILGACAYFSELLMLTDGFRRPVPRREAFMALCFGPLYVLMGIVYLLE